MESLFSPCTRLHDHLESQGRLEEFINPELLQEINLDVSTDELLSAERAFSYADLYAMLGIQNTVAWLTPHAAVVSGIVGSYYHGYKFCSITADSKNIIAFARSPEHLLEICDIVVRLLAASVVHSVSLFNLNVSDTISINTTSLAYLMEQCHSLKSLTLVNLDMDENHCRVLDSYSKPGLEMVLNYCGFTSAGASTLVDVLGRNQGPTKLDSCRIDNLVLADGLRGNSRLKSLKLLRISRSPEVGNREILAIADALRENKGLVDLNLRWWGCRVSDETWRTFCDSLKAHPTLEILDLRRTFAEDATVKSRMQVLSDMVKVNTSIHTIHLFQRHNGNENEFFRGSIVPYLETNRFRPRVRAIQKTRPIMHRAKVLGRALLVARNDANTFWMFLSGNAEVAFPSTIATTSLPTPATTPATANATPVAASAAVTLAVSATSAAAANADTPTARQKRKARP
jgi:hypothetical protein